MSFATTLQHRISIQARAEGSDDGGDASTEWTEVCTVYADIRFPRGSEMVRAGAVASAVQCSIRIRMRAGLDASMRVAHGTDFYEIKTVLPDMVRKDRMDLVCELIK